MRESTGLELCPRAPSLFARGQEHRLIVMSDLGDLPTLADLLLGDDRDAAWAGAQTWARALGQAAGATRSMVAEAELAGALRLRDPGAAAIVSPTDTCPDNAVLGPDGWWFLDLEGTEVQHAVLAAAYAVLPFATCWCMFDPPPGLTDLLLAEHAPHVAADPGWDAAVRQACALYLVLVTGWLWRSTMEGRRSVGPEG